MPEPKVLYQCGKMDKYHKIMYHTLYIIFEDFCFFSVLFHFKCLVFNLGMSSIAKQDHSAF